MQRGIQKKISVNPEIAKSETRYARIAEAVKRPVSKGENTHTQFATSYVSAVRVLYHMNKGTSVFTLCTISNIAGDVTYATIPLPV